MQEKIAADTQYAVGAFDAIAGLLAIIAKHQGLDLKDDLGKTSRKAPKCIIPNLKRIGRMALRMLLQSSRVCLDSDEKGEEDTETVGSRRSPND